MHTMQLRQLNVYEKKGRLLIVLGGAGVLFIFRRIMLPAK